MALASVFNPEVTQYHLSRLDKLTNTTKPIWGKMNAAQMLAHINVGYDISNGLVKSNPNFFTKLILKLIVKGIVTGEKPYPRNSSTAPEFVIANERDFEKEKLRLISHIKETELKGATHFEGKENASFGILTAQQWNNQFYKHIEHHFAQFGI